MSPAIVAAVLGAGAVGAVARYLVSRAFKNAGDTSFRAFLVRIPVFTVRSPAFSKGWGAGGGRSGFPWAVLVVNVAGSVIGGAVLGLAIRGDISADLRLILLTGLCGGVTTFSTFSVETVQLVLDGKGRTAAASVIANLVVGVGGAAAACAVTLAL